MTGPLHRDEWLAGELDNVEYIATLEAELARAHAAYDLAVVSIRAAIRMAAETSKELEQARLAPLVECTGEEAATS